MKRNLFLGTLFSAALAVGVSAQTGSQAGQQGSQKQSQQNMQVTVTGCLHSADMAGGGAAGTTGTGTAGTTGQSRSSSSAEFMLTNAKITSGGSGMAGTTGTGTTGTTGATAGSMGKFKLTGGNQQELREYVNSQVEIHGTLQHQAANPSGAAAGTGTGSTGQTQKKMEDESVQTIRVTSAKQVSKTCTGADR